MPVSLRSNAIVKWLATPHYQSSKIYRRRREFGKLSPAEERKCEGNRKQYWGHCLIVWPVRYISSHHRWCIRSTLPFWMCAVLCSKGIKKLKIAFFSQTSTVDDAKCRQMIPHESMQWNAIKKFVEWRTFFRYTYSERFIFNLSNITTVMNIDWTWKARSKY